MARYSKEEIAEARAMLEELCPIGTRVYTVLRHVSRSGMMRHISFFVLDKDADGKPWIRSVSWAMARVLGYTMARDGNHALKVGGAGMDLGFHVVHSLSYALHGHAHAPGSIIKPGYTLTHEWI